MQRRRLDPPIVRHPQTDFEATEFMSDGGDDPMFPYEDENETVWDDSTLNSSLHTPQRIHFAQEAAANGAYPGYTPLNKRNHVGVRAYPIEAVRRPQQNSSLRSPLDMQPRSARAQDSDLYVQPGGYRFPVSNPIDVDSVFVDSDDESVQSTLVPSMSYGPSKYLHTFASPPPPSYRYPGGVQPTAPQESPSNRSLSSALSSSTMGARRTSMMSHKSSTSMSLLFGEVINLENDSQLALSGGPVRGRSPYHRFHDRDVESQGSLAFEGMEIGGGSLPRHDYREQVQSQVISGIIKGARNVKQIAQTTTVGINLAMSTARKITQRIANSYKPPLSPRARALEDLEYLQRTHKEKVGQLTENSELQEHYDFVLLLKPQQAYKYWANILDFRVEHLGEEFVAAMDPRFESSSTMSTDSTNSDEGMLSGMAPRRQSPFSPPLTGMRRRTRTPARTPQRTPLRTPGTVDRSTLTPESTGLMAMFQRPSLSTIASTPANPNNQSFMSARPRTQRFSMFEKAVGIAESPMTINPADSVTGIQTPVQEQRTTVPSTVRRRWGNRASATGSATVNMLSPPVRSITRGSTSLKSVKGASAAPSKASNKEDQENRNPNRIESEEDIPNQVIPRGIAARTNGMLPFLSALKRGFVVRRHRPNRQPIFCKIFSNDGGDTIQYHFIDREEALVALREQAIRHNRKLKMSSTQESMRQITQDWAVSEEADDEKEDIHNFNMPDHVAAHRYRENFFRKHGIKKRLFEVANQAANSGFIKARDLVAVHPAFKPDPRHPGNRKGELGTASFRKSKAEYHIPFSFSIVVKAAKQMRSKTTKKSRSEEAENKWYSGEGNDLQFKTIDFEAASEGEYWLFFRGFILLHRDVAVGRFAADRRAGIGGGIRSNRDDRDSGEKEPIDELENRLHRDEFLEPVTVGCIERAIVQVRKLDATYMRGAISPTAVPPPSDYFLGFKSPGTQIWSRLRLAGLETARIYAVDSKRVMLKVRCPEDRLTDVAEVLRVQMRTMDGSYIGFREDTADLFKPLNDFHDVPAMYRGGFASLLRSKDRQNIIDFIIGSRIRDSGAELGPTTDLGKMIQARIPLHMHEKLDALFKPWVFYWRAENWTGARSLTSQEESVSSPIKGDESDLEASKGEDLSKMAVIAENEVPDFFTRFFIGAFHQPLDAIEEYFGEQVTFYFAWLQHCARHLLVLTIIGLFVTICQISSNNFDHPIRPLFSLVVMVWTFMVLINWRKRSNLLAYKWGSMDYKVQETPRPEFHGEYVRDEITGEWIVTYPKWKRYLKYLISVPICCGFTAMAALLILLVHANRDIQITNYMNQRNDPDAEPFKLQLSLDNIRSEQKLENAGIELTGDLVTDPTFWVAMGALPAMLGLCIPLLNMILMNISVMLNNFENYQTESEYRTHLIIKVFSFRFVSQFGTLYYYAAISMKDPTTIQNGMVRMATSVMIYTTVSHWWSIFLQVYFFMLIRNIRLKLYQRKLRNELKKIELEEMEVSSDLSDAEARQIRIINKRMLLDQAQDDIWFEIMNPPHDSFPEYITAVVQFSFVACFSIVLPITPFFCLVNYLLSMRYDAYKVCRGRRRPLAKKTGGIGIWEHLLHIVVVIAVLTNCWLIAFTAADLRWIAEEIGEFGLFAFVVAWEHLMLLVKYVMQTTISPLPKSIRDQMKREQHHLDVERYTSMRTKNLDRRGKTEKEISASATPARPVMPLEELIGVNRSTVLNSPTRKLDTISSDEESLGSTETVDA